MALNVKFLKGSQAGYDALGAKDANSFYLTESNLYLGSMKLSNAADVADALAKLGDLSTLSTTAKGNLVAALNEAVADLATVKTDMGAKASLSTTAKTNLVAAINELKAAIDANQTAGAITITTDTTTTGMAKSYTVKQGTTQIGVIDIPKDMVVSSGKVVKDPAGQTAGTYIELTLANAASDKLYINVGTLIDIYTAKAEAAQVQIAIDSTTREISATIKAGSITATELAANAVTTAKIADANVTTDKIADKNVTKGKLEQDVQDSLGKADSALQAADIAEGATNGSVKVKGTDVAVHGLKGAAYEDVSAFDAAGDADQALVDAKAYVDAALTWTNF